jgi:hypothetical protein
MANLADLLVAVDERPASDAGAFVIEDGALRGSVLVETSRVCWAQAPGRSARLRDLLRRHAERAVGDAELADAFARCRDEHRPLGDILAERDLVSERGLRAAIKQHTVESLIAQCNGSHDPVTWVPHRSYGYRPRFTFPPVDLLAAAGAALYPDEAAGADLALEPALPGARTAGSFAIGDDDTAIAVCIAGAAQLAVRDVLELGDWAAAALAACSGFSPGVMARAIADTAGHAVLGWRSTRRRVHVAMFDAAEPLSGAVASLARRGIPAVLSSRVPVHRASPSSSASSQLPTTTRHAEGD